MQLRRVHYENPDEELKTFYEKLLSLTGKDVFYDGEWELKEVASSGTDDFRNLIAYRWKSKNLLKLVVVNFGPDRQQGRISLKNEITRGRDFVLYDELNDQRHIREGNNMVNPGLHVILEGFQSHIFDISPAL